MRHSLLIDEMQGDEPCRYGSSRLLFRGPRKPLDGRHVAFLGGSETLGQDVRQPYPLLLERELGEVCINLAQPNASVDVYLYDTIVPNICADAALTVMTVTGAQNMSNRLYSVHPRRNDRFVKASAQLRALYPEVDFAEICYTGHLLLTLYEASSERFETVREELQTAWVARMRTFLDRVGRRVLLVRFASESGAGCGAVRDMERFVTATMIAKVRPLAWDVVTISPAADRSTLQSPGRVARTWDEEAHHRVADALKGPIETLLLEATKASTKI